MTSTANIRITGTGYTMLEWSTGTYGTAKSIYVADGATVDFGTRLYFYDRTTFGETPYTNYVYGSAGSCMLRRGNHDRRRQRRMTSGFEGHTNVVLDYSSVNMTDRFADAGT